MWNRKHTIKGYLLVLIVPVIASCRANVVNRPDLEPNTAYSGTFTIQQSNYYWSGTVTLDLSQNSFVQDGTIKDASTGKSQHIHNEGDLHIYTDSVEFNRGIENSTAVYPNWILMGMFASSQKHGKLKLSQSYDKQYSYVILLDKKL